MKDNKVTVVVIDGIVQNVYSSIPSTQVVILEREDHSQVVDDVYLHGLYRVF